MMHSQSQLNNGVMSMLTYSIFKVDEFYCGALKNLWLAPVTFTITASCHITYYERDK